MNAKRSTGARTHRFGGDWTTAKLGVIARYLASYTTALKEKPSKEHPFVKGYIDAFAGTGYARGLPIVSRELALCPAM